MHVSYSSRSLRRPSRLFRSYSKARHSQAAARPRTRQRVRPTHSCSRPSRSQRSAPPPPPPRFLPAFRSSRGGTTCTEVRGRASRRRLLHKVTTEAGVTRSRRTRAVRRAGTGESGHLQMCASTTSRVSSASDRTVAFAMCSLTVVINLLCCWLDNYSIRIR